MLLSHVKHFSNEILGITSGGAVLLMPSFGQDLLFWLEVGTKISLLSVAIISALRAFDKYKKKQ